MGIINHAENIILVELQSEPKIRPELDKAMQMARHETDSDVIVDLSRVDILLSLSISGFVQLHKLLTAHGRRLVFFNASELTRNIFKLTCVDCFFEFVEDRDAAIAALNAPVAAE